MYSSEVVTHNNFCIRSTNSHVMDTQNEKHRPSNFVLGEDKVVNHSMNDYVEIAKLMNICFGSR